MAHKVLARSESVSSARRKVSAIEGPGSTGGYTIFGYPGASASNRVRAAAESSPWWQGRLVCRAAAMGAGRLASAEDYRPTPPAESSQVAPPILAGSEEPVVLIRTIHIDLGAGAVTALPIGTLMPVIKDWDWSSEAEAFTSAPVPIEVEEATAAPARNEAPDLALPTTEPEWNEDDELPTWLAMDRVQVQSGALMSRRRPADPGD